MDARRGLRVLPLFAVAVVLATPLFSATVTGRLTMGDGVAPGFTVELTSDGWSAKTVTNANGEYTLEVPRGDYELTFELAGFGKTTHHITVDRSELRLGDDEMTPITTEDTIVIDERPCGPPPTTPMEDPSCQDYDFDDVLITAADSGDNSALDLLEWRYATVMSSFEQQTIAAALVAHRRVDGTTWNQLMADASNAVRFAAAKDGSANPDLAPWCAAHGYDPDAYYRLAGLALQTVSTDPRSRALLLDALKTNDDWAIFTAINGLGHQRDASSLADIEQTLLRVPNAEQLAGALASFQSQAADRLMARFSHEPQQ